MDDLSVQQQLAVAGVVATGAYMYMSTPRKAEKIRGSAPRSINDSYSVYKPGEKVSTVSKTDTVPIKLAATGIASAEGTPVTTVSKLLQKACAKFGDSPALRCERPLKELAKGETPPPALPTDQWTTWTYNEYYSEACLAAKAMMKVGVGVHDAVTIFGFNAPEWVMGEVSAILCGGIAAGIYPTDTAEQVAFKLNHSGSVVSVVGDMSKYEKIASKVDDIPTLKAIVAWDAPEVSGNVLKRKDGSTVQVFTWKEFVEFGKDVDDDDLNQRIEAQEPGQCCCIIYTSGTTGNPKGVMISHDNIIFEANTVFQSIDGLGADPSTPERILSYLPLSHVAGMLVDIILPIQVTSMRAPVELWFARVYDLKAGSLGDRLRACRPTLFLGVPRVWEKVAEKLKAVGAATKGLKKKLSSWAKAKSSEHQANCQMGGSGAYPPFFAPADALLTVIKKKLGLDACKFGLTGAAPITKDTLEYFGSLGIQINECYGMSECCGATTISLDDAHVWGSCGFEVAGCEVKVFKVDEKDLNKKEECPVAKDIFAATEEEQGEICFRGRHIMMGYMANAALGKDHVKTIQKKTDEAVDADGWLHSGDKGCVDDRGMVKITGRYKELIIGAGGENVAPVPMEDNIKRLHAGISNVMMFGDKRKYNVCVVSLKTKGATGEKPGTDDLDGGALDINPEVATLSAAKSDATWIKSITDAITATNNDPACCPMNAAKIQKFTILPTDFSVETEELTPTLKLKRSVAEKKYAAAIDAMYKSKDIYVPC